MLQLASALVLVLLATQALVRVWVLLRWSFLSSFQGQDDAAVAREARSGLGTAHVARLRATLTPSLQIFVGTTLFARGSSR
jgi:hypothetical protein